MLSVLLAGCFFSACATQRNRQRCLICIIIIIVLQPSLQRCHHHRWDQPEIVVQGMRNTSAQPHPSLGNPTWSRWSLATRSLPLNARRAFSGLATVWVGGSAGGSTPTRMEYCSLAADPQPLNVHSLPWDFRTQVSDFLRHSLVFKLLIPQSPITARVTPETVACHSERTFNVVPVGIECCSRANTSHVVLQRISRNVTN